MAAKDGKAVAQVLDSKRDHSEAPSEPVTSARYRLEARFPGVHYHG
jgi:hypothetical protein